jgi:hypothetical protein
LRASNSAIVSALIMPRSATTQTRLIEKRLRNRLWRDNLGEKAATVGDGILTVAAA